MIQFFESSWTNTEARAADLFMAGYGSIWVPPPSKAGGGLSVGYDVYDRFNLGSPTDQTLYGTETGFRKLVKELHRSGITVYSDEVWNHNGYGDQSNSGFVAAGGYPGFVLSVPGNSNGDFHAANASGDLNARLDGLIDIAQDSNYQYVRNPIPGQANNLPAGTYANIPTEANRRFYQNRNRAPDRIVFNPTTGQTGIPIWNFTSDTATTGTPVQENALGYLMRHAQWMLQDIGVDGFRLDATKHVPTWVWNDYFDLAVYRGNPRLALDGSVKQVFSFGENFDGSKSYLQDYIRKDINPNDVGRVGGNRDTKDFPLYFALQSNLSNNGLANSWYNVTGASQDSQDDGNANNGSQGVAFVQSADSFGPYLSNVAYAYTLMRPGNSIVYFNAKQFGTNRDFPKDGRGDALGGMYGDTITKLVGLRNTHGRGDYIERWIEKETLIYERDKSAVVGLSNRVDNGYDTRTVQTNFGPGTRLIEMTGNATDATVDPTNVIADYVVVDATGKITIAVPRART
ncbi:MAG: alpha-amylase family glycosyl hydrolase [Tepidisphaeraceae bacterium]